MRVEPMNLVQAFLRPRTSGATTNSDRNLLAIYGGTVAVTNSLLALRKWLIALMALFAATVALAVPTASQSSNAAGGPVTQVIVWGDSMSLTWGDFLQPLLGVPVISKGVGAEDIQRTESRFKSWLADPTNADKIATTGHLCWCGHVNRNPQHVGTNKDADTIVPTLQRMAAQVPFGQFMPIGLTNGPQAPGPNPNATPPTAASRDYVLMINDQTAKMTAINEIMASPRPTGFGASYAEVREYLVTDGLRLRGITPTATDLANIAVDVPPRSLRRDTEDPDTDAHLNDAGKRVTASRLNDLIRAAGWLTPSQYQGSTTSAGSTPNPSIVGQEIQLTASVRSASGTSTPTGSVQFYVDGLASGESVAVPGSGNVMSSPTATLAAGEHRIDAVYSGDATFATSSGWFNQVVNGSGSQGPPPALVTATPVANATAIVQGSNVTATFSESVTGVSGTTFKLTNPVGTLISATVTYSPSTFVATLDPAANLAADTRYTATLSGGSTAIRDADGNSLATTSWTFLTGPAPTVTATAPADGATGVSRTANITATFNEQVNGVSGSTFTLTDSVTGAVVPAGVSHARFNNKWILNPSVTLAANTRYTITLTEGPTAIRDLAGNPMIPIAPRSFTTGP